MSLDDLPETLEETANSGHRLHTLYKLRELVAHELEGNRCQNCRMTQMRTGEFSSLAKRLQEIMAEIDELEALDPTRRQDDGVDDLASRVVELRAIAGGKK